MISLNTEERQVIEAYLYLQILLKVVELDVAQIEQSKIKLKQPYFNLLETTRQAIKKDFVHAKQNMQRYGIRIHEHERDQLFTTYLFQIRGYTETHKYFNPHIRNQVNKRLDFYLNGAAFSLEKQPQTLKSSGNY